jgi:hypothetical protein
MNLRQFGHPFPCVELGAEPIVLRRTPSCARLLQQDFCSPLNTLYVFKRFCCDEKGANNLETAVRTFRRQGFTRQWAATVRE